MNVEKYRLLVEVASQIYMKQSLAGLPRYLTLGMLIWLLNELAYTNNISTVVFACTSDAYSLRFITNRPSDGFGWRWLFTFADYFGCDINSRQKWITGSARSNNDNFVASMHLDRLFTLGKLFWYLLGTHFILVAWYQVTRSYCLIVNAQKVKEKEGESEETKENEERVEEEKVEREENNEISDKNSTINLDSISIDSDVSESCIIKQF